MNFNKLLEKQIKKYLPENWAALEGLSGFINAVNNSYNAFEKDLTLSAHAFRISEQDYVEMNEQLKKEIDTRKLGVINLKEAIKSIDGSAEWVNEIDENENTLIDTLNYL